MPRLWLSHSAKVLNDKTCTDTHGPPGYLGKPVMLKISLFLLQLQSYKSYFEKEKYPFMQKMNYKLKKNKLNNWHANKKHKE